MVKIFQEAVKSPVRRKRQGDIKSAVMGNEKVVVKRISKVNYHGETFIFNDDERTNHGMLGKDSALAFGVFLNGR